MTTTAPSTTRVAAVPVLLAGLGAQIADNVVTFFLPFTAPVVGPLSGISAIVLTAVLARLLTQGKTGPVVARTGLAVGLSSAAIGLLVGGGLGIIAMLLGIVTIVVGVGAAVAGRGLTSRDV